MILEKTYGLLRFVNDKYLKFTKFLLAVLVFGMLVCGFLQVFSRFVLKSPIPWSEEILTYSFSWVSFLGASYAIYTKSHFSVDLLVRKFPPRLYRIVEIVIWMLLLLFSLVVFVVGIDLTRRNSIQTMNILPISVLWAYITVPLSFFMMSSYSAQHILGFFLNVKEEVEP